jgi:hypothetical protein
MIHLFLLCISWFVKSFKRRIQDEAIPNCYSIALCLHEYQTSRLSAAKEWFSSYHPIITNQEWWSVPTVALFNATTNLCKCNINSGLDDIVKCTEQGINLRVGQCMTYEEKEGVIYIAHCNYFNGIRHYSIDDNGRYIQLSVKNASELNTILCVAQWIGMVHYAVNIKTALGHIHYFTRFSV